MYDLEASETVNNKCLQVTFALRNSPKKLSTTTISLVPCLAVEDPDMLRKKREDINLWWRKSKAQTLTEVQQGLHEGLR